RLVASHRPRAAARAHPRRVRPHAGGDAGVGPRQGAGPRPLLLQRTNAAGARGRGGDDRVVQPHRTRRAVGVAMKARADPRRGNPTTRGPAPGGPRAMRLNDSIVTPTT